MYRLDANYLLNIIERTELQEKFPQLVPLKDVCRVENQLVRIQPEKMYQYLEVPDISEFTGTITNIRCVMGSSLGSTSFYKFQAGDILFTRINPRKSRVAIAPPIDGDCIVSKEVFRLVYKDNPYISFENRYVLKSIMQSSHVRNQIVRLSTGSSSSRARVQVDDLLSDVYIPIPDVSLQEQISQTEKTSVEEIWSISQKYLTSFADNQTSLGGCVKVDEIRSL